MPFDQQLGKYHSLFSGKSFRQNISNIFKPLASSKGEIDIPYADIHIRRGDCTYERFPEWYIEDTYYFQLFETLTLALPANMPIHICTQGNIDWIRDWLQSRKILQRKIYVNSSNSNFSNDQEIDHFMIMANSSVLITCGSSFGHWAGIVGKVPKIIDFSKIQSPLNTAPGINPEQEIGNIEKLIKRCLIPNWDF